MIRVSLLYIFDLANKLEPLSQLPTVDTEYGNIWIQLLVAEGAVESLYRQALYGP
jgi:hypothetical protein